MGAQLILLKPDDVAASTKIASRIVNSMDRIDQLIHDLLDGSKLRAGEKLSFDLNDCDLDAILSQVAEELRLENPSRIAYKSQGPVVGHWNESGLRRIVENLVTNALKFSPPESCVTIALKKIGATVEVSVRNSGKPITQEEKAALFQNFRRAKNSEGKEGWGLGLTVVKGITEAHGGRVGVDSSAEAGTVFRVTLPLVVTESHAERLTAKHGQSLLTDVRKGEINKVSLKV
jgi:signal transduction histidine kinase